MFTQISGLRCSIYGAKENGDVRWILFDVEELDRMCLHLYGMDADLDMQGFIVPRSHHVSLIFVRQISTNVSE